MHQLNLQHLQSYEVNSGPGAWWDKNYRYFITASEIINLTHLIHVLFSFRKVKKKAEGNEHGIRLDAEHFENAHLELKHNLSCSYTSNSRGLYAESAKCHASAISLEEGEVTDQLVAERPCIFVKISISNIKLVSCFYLD